MPDRTRRVIQALFYLLLFVVLLQLAVGFVEAHFLHEGGDVWVTLPVKRSKQ